MGEGKNSRKWRFVLRLSSANCRGSVDKTMKIRQFFHYVVFKCLKSGENKVLKITCNCNMTASFVFNYNSTKSAFCATRYGLRFSMVLDAGRIHGFSGHFPRHGNNNYYGKTKSTLLQ